MVPLLSIFSKGLIFFIKFYQKYISCIIQPRCRFYPSCSQYAINVLKNFNLIMSIWLIFMRMLKCQPLFIDSRDTMIIKTTNTREQ